MIFVFLFGFILIVLIIKFLKLKIHIDFSSFFKKGFKKLDNKFGLFCYVGKQGKGKTYSSISFITRQKNLYGYTIITNVKSFNKFSDTIYMSNINDIIDFVNKNYKKTKFIIFFDEIFTILEKKTPLNKKILSFLSQLRKKKLIMVTTAQEWSEINITFRRYTRYQIDCNMFAIPFLKTAFIYNAINDGDKIRWNNDLQDFVAPRVATNFAKCERAIINSYDTFEVISV